MYYWQASEASETLLGLNNGNGRFGEQDTIRHNQWKS